MSLQDLNRRNSIFTKQLLDKAKKQKKAEPVKEVTESTTDVTGYSLEDIQKQKSKPKK